MPPSVAVVLVMLAEVGVVTVGAIANALNVTGWVRNREDGSVEAVVQGDEDAVEQLVGWCHNGPPGANVKYVNANLFETDENFMAFSRRPNEER